MENIDSFTIYLALDDLDPLWIFALLDKIYWTLKMRGLGALRSLNFLQQRPDVIVPARLHTFIS